MTQLSPNTVPDLGGTFFKVDVIKDAYSKMRISGLTVNPTPEDLELALTRYENMMAEWYSKNVVIGYNFEEKPDPNTENHVIRSYQDCMSSCLAIRLIPDFNKQVHQVLYGQASSSYSSMSGRVASERLQGVTYPTRQAKGSGNTLRWSRWSRFYREFNTGLNNPAQKTMFIGDITDFTEHFESYLNKAEVILSYSIVADAGLILSNVTNDDKNVMYRVEATDPTGDNSTTSQLVTIIITTDLGRISTRQILFELVPRINRS